MPSPDRVMVMRFEGAFDLSAAQRVAEALSACDDSSEVYVDLTRIRYFDDRAVGLLARGLNEARGPVSVKGLSRHQYRLMRYLGVRSAALGAERLEALPAHGAAES